MLEIKEQRKIAFVLILALWLNTSITPVSGIDTTKFEVNEGDMYTFMGYWDWYSDGVLDQSEEFYLGESTQYGAVTSQRGAEFNLIILVSDLRFARPAYELYVEFNNGTATAYDYIRIWDENMFTSGVESGYFLIPDWEFLEQDLNTKFAEQESREDVESIEQTYQITEDEFIIHINATYINEAMILDNWGLNAAYDKSTGVANYRSNYGNKIVKPEYCDAEVPESCNWGYNVTILRTGDIPDNTEASSGDSDNPKVNWFIPIMIGGVLIGGSLSGYAGRQYIKKKDS